MNTFEMKTAIHFGADALGRLRDIPYKRVLVITDPFVVKSGMIDMITKPLQAGGKEFDIFCDVVPDAPVGKIAEGVKKFLQYQPEAIVAVGGISGSEYSILGISGCFNTLLTMLAELPPHTIFLPSGIMNSVTNLSSQLLSIGGPL